MKFFKPRYFAKKKVLYVWDGTNRWFAKAGDLIEELGPVSVCAVRAMPHGSIYGYGSICSEDRMNWLEIELLRKFQKMAKPFRSFRNVNLTLLFGDRVNEIARFANQSKVSGVITPRFEQSSFSTWIHGDINKRLASKVLSEVFVLNHETIEKIQSE